MTADPSPTHHVVIALGANLGDRERTLTDAIGELESTERITVISVSPFIETPALTLDGVDASKPVYLNAVAMLRTDLDPLELLDVLAAIEVRHGRVRLERWDDRTLDLDIIDFDRLELRSERLTLPHPRAFERDFVIRPWLTIDPDAVLPGHGPIAALPAAGDGRL